MIETKLTEAETLLVLNALTQYIFNPPNEEDKKLAEKKQGNRSEILRSNTLETWDKTH